MTATALTTCATPSWSKEAGPTERVAFETVGSIPVMAICCCSGAWLRSHSVSCFLAPRIVGQVIGFYNKTQPAAKPIYKRSRIILGVHGQDAALVGRYDYANTTARSMTREDESYRSFINANRIYPGIIATQCPLESTALDVLQMVVEQRVTLWIQLAPSAAAAVRSSRSSTCKLFPEQYSLQAVSSTEHAPTGSVIVDAVRSLATGEAAFNALSIDLRYKDPMISLPDHDDAKREDDGHRPSSCDSSSSSSSRWSQHTLLIERYLGWEDFELPPEAHHEVQTAAASHCSRQCCCELKQHCSLR